MTKKVFFLLLLVQGVVLVFAQDGASRLLEILDNALNTAADSSKTAPAAGQSLSDVPAFNIINNTGFTIKSIFICPVDSEIWETSIFNGSLYNGQSTRINLELPLSKANRYNIRLVDVDGDRYSKYDIDISSPLVIVVSISDFEF